MRKLICFLLALVLASCVEQEPARDATPLDEYYAWDKWEQRCNDGGDAFLAAARRENVGNVFLQVEDVTEWWTFAVEMGAFSAPEFIVSTTAGTYTSDDVVFATFQQREIFRAPVVVDETYEKVPWRGGWRVVAFVHFPAQPKGDLVEWSYRR